MDKCLIEGDEEFCCRSANMPRRRIKIHVAEIFQIRLRWRITRDAFLYMTILHYYLARIKISPPFSVVNYVNTNKRWVRVLAAVCHRLLQVTARSCECTRWHTCTIHNVDPRDRCITRSRERVYKRDTDTHARRSKKISLSGRRYTERQISSKPPVPEGGTICGD